MIAFNRLLVILIGICGLCGTTSAEFLIAQQRAPVELALADETGVVDAHWVTLEIAALTRGSDLLEFAMPDGTRYRARQSFVENRHPGDLTWRGWLEGRADLRVVLTLKNQRIAGRMETPNGTFEIRPGKDKNEVHLLLELDLDAFPVCAGGVHADIKPAASSAGGRGTSSQIDVMALYTPQARDAAGGVAQIETTIQAAVDNANTAFIDSNMSARLNLVHTELAGYSDSGSLSSDLNWLRNDADVSALRDAQGADLVGLIVESPGCGIGYVMRDPGPGFESFGFQVTDRGCAVGNLSYAHEHGHNMGFEHDPANGPSSSDASYSWSFGHFVDGSYRTVMSYSNQCTSGCSRVTHFSNPSVSESGTATGIANQRDNARTGELTAPIVAGFRASAGTLPEVSNPWPGDGSTVALGSSGQLLRVYAPDATSGVFHYDDGPAIVWSDPAAVNGDFLEIVVPYTDCQIDGRMGDCGTNYWYVVANNSVGSTRFPDSGTLSFTIFSNARSCAEVSEADSAISNNAVLSACSELTVGPSMIFEAPSDALIESGDLIRFLPGISVEQGAQLRMRTCGQNLCALGANPLESQCHSCVEQICAVDASCCTTAWNQQCVDQVETVCGLSCN